MRCAGPPSVGADVCGAGRHVAPGVRYGVYRIQPCRAMQGHFPVGSCNKFGRLIKADLASGRPAHGSRAPPMSPIGRSKPASAALVEDQLDLRDFLQTKAHLPSARIPTLLRVLKDHWITDVTGLVSSLPLLEKHLPAAAFLALQRATHEMHSSCAAPPHCAFVYY